MNQTGIVTLFSPGFNLIRGDLIRAERHTRVLNQGPPSTRSSKGVRMNYTDGVLLLASSPPDSILICCCSLPIGKG